VFFIWNETKQEYVEETDKERVAEFTKQKKGIWKPVLTLNFIIPKIRGVLGMWQFQTSGDKTSIHAIRDAYDRVKEMAGTVINIPFDLVVKKVKSNKPNDNRSYPVVCLIPNVSTENIELLRNFLQQGINIREMGMLTEDKLSKLALEEHTVDADAVEVKDEQKNDEA
jgi:hypothetical protein